MAVLDDDVWAERREVVRLLRESGLLGTEFARREGILYNTLKGWIKRLLQLDRAESLAAFAKMVVQRNDVLENQFSSEWPHV